MEEGRSASNILTVKSTRKIPIRRHRWEDNIRIKLKEMSVSIMNWIVSVHGMNYLGVLVKMALNLRVQTNLIMKIVIVTQ